MTLFNSTPQKGPHFHRGTHFRVCSGVKIHIKSSYATASFTMAFNYGILEECTLTIANAKETSYDFGEEETVIEYR
jgi:hypothetical protein